MTTCAYCDRPATETIIATPHHVCLAHALEFWTGLLGYARGRTGPCVKDHHLCACPLCDEQEALRLRALAIRSVGPSPGDHDDLPFRIAS